MKRKFTGALLVLGIALVLAVDLCLGIAAGMGRPKPIVYGNRRMPEKGPGTTRIAVFGDTQKGLASFAMLFEAAKREGIDLAVHTGDLVSHADTGHYDLALTWVQRGRGEIPFLVTPGNHDLKGDETLFPSRIGPLQVGYRWGPVDLVIANNALGPPDEVSVEKLLASAKGPILLFMHVPLFDATREEFVVKPEYERFLEMLERHPVRYVFSGHAHAYRRIERQGTVYIANGVGGDSDSWQFDQRAHMTLVEATPDLVKDRGISIDPVFSFWANVEHLAVGHVSEHVLRTFYGFPLLVLAHVGLLFWLRRRRRKPAEQPQVIGIQ